MRPIRLPGAVVAITGAARGIGRETARAFSRAGATVVLGDLDAELAIEAADEVGGHGFGLDVRSTKSFRAFIKAAEEVAGPLDVLVNNAGIMPLGHFADESETTADAIIDINVKGVITGMKLVLPGMLERRHGHIVNIASMAGRVPVAGGATYSASKFAVIGLSRSVREEISGSGVTVTAILPTMVRTELSSGIDTSGPLPVVEPSDIAAAVVDSCRSRSTAIPVPRWMSAYDAVEAFVPNRLMENVRGRLAGSRVFGANLEARAAYLNRVHDTEDRKA